MILDQKHQMQKQLFRQFAEAEFTSEILEELDTTGQFNWDMHRLMAANGFMGVKIPTAYGGQGADNLTFICRDFLIDYLAAIFRCKHNMVFAVPLTMC